MEIKVIGKDRAEVKIGRQLEVANSKEFRNKMLELADQGIKNIRLDFSDTERLDSSGLGKLLFFSEKFRGMGGDFALDNVCSKNLSDLFRLLHLDQIIKINYKEVG